MTTPGLDAFRAAVLSNTLSPEQQEALVNAIDDAAPFVNAPITDGDARAQWAWSSALYAIAGAAGGGTMGSFAPSISVANAAALEAFDETAFPLGSTAYTATYGGARWSLEPTQPAVADQVLTALDGRSWVRTGSANPAAALTQAIWHINGPGGHNEADGLTSGTALADFGELLRRLGTESPAFPQDTVIQWDADDGQVGSGGSYSFSPIMNQGNQPDLADAPGILLNLVGVKKVVASGTLGAVTAYSEATGTAWQVDLGSNASSAAQRMLVNTTRNAICWVDSVSGTVATITQPYAPSVTPPPAWWFGGAGAPALVNTFAPGDAYELVDLPQVRFGSLQPTTIGFWQAEFDGILCMVGNLHVPDGTGSGEESFLCNTTCRITECRIEPTIETLTDADNGVAEQIFNSCLDAGGKFESSGIVGGTIGPVGVFSIFSGCALDGRVYVHGTVSACIFTSPTRKYAVNAISSIFMFGDLTIFAPTQIVTGQYGLPVCITGTYRIGNTAPSGALYYQGTAANAFQGTPTLLNNSTSHAVTFDKSGPTITAGIALTVANLDTAAPTGFGGICLHNDLSPAYISKTKLAS